MVFSSQRQLWVWVHKEELPLPRFQSTREREREERGGGGEWRWPNVWLGWPPSLHAMENFQFPFFLLKHSCLAQGKRENGDFSLCACYVCLREWMRNGEMGCGGGERDVGRVVENNCQLGLRKWDMCLARC